MVSATSSHSRRHVEVPHLRITIETDDETAVLTPAGAIDIETAPAFRVALDEVVQSGATHVVVDLAELDFLAVIGARCLLDLADDDGLPPGGVELDVVNASDLARQVLVAVGVPARHAAG